MTLISPQDARSIHNGTHSDPFSLLGLHRGEEGPVIRVFMPEADSVEIMDATNGQFVMSLSRAMPDCDVFAALLPQKNAAEQGNAFGYKLRITKGDHVWTEDDPYRFGPVIGALDEHLFAEGTHRTLWRILGAHIIEHEGISGTHFAVWAPNAQRVSVVGDFNGWNGRRHVMRKRGATGIWEIFIPNLGEGEPYKYELLDEGGHLLPQKADPVGFGAEHPPQTASIIRKLDGYVWQDTPWMTKRAALNRFDQPISIYEVHLGSWKRVPEEGNRPLSYQELAQDLVGYVKHMGFTHIELMPISEFPFDGSWGYQPVGLYAPTIRHGTLDEFRALIDACHAADIGVIIDWVPGHFPEDAHGLGRFDGTALYEHADSREGFHPDWNTLVYNYGRTEVANFLTNNALYWLKEFHIDGLRVDAVASMLYRDYSRKEGEWVPNKDGGRENYEAINFLQSMNAEAYGKHDGIMTVAEESTAFPKVSAPTDQGGLGFGFKWNMGWMNDTLSYMAQDPIHRKYHHHQMTFGIHYAFTENFILPLSHDEVVHGKGSLLNKMPGNDDEKFANLRAYYGFMWGHPGKKLLFMGGEFAQGAEWNHDASLDWHVLDYDLQRGMQTLVRDLNHIYSANPALYQRDTSHDGFEWVEANAEEESVFAWIRRGEGDTAPILVVSNMTPVERQNYAIGVPHEGCWTEILNTDSTLYAGLGRGNLGAAHTSPNPVSGQPHSLSLTLPPLATLYFKLERP